MQEVFRQNKIFNYIISSNSQQYFGRHEVREDNQNDKVNNDQRDSNI